MVFKTAANLARRKFKNHRKLINLFDHRPHWARVLEALHYEQFITRDTPFDEIDGSNAHPIGLSIEDYKGAIEFLDEHGLIDFTPLPGMTFEGVTTEGFEWIRNRQRTKAQSQQKRATSKLTLALLIISAETFIDQPNIEIWGVNIFTLGVGGMLGYIGLSVVYDIVIREY